jgi:hypothetical protein
LWIALRRGRHRFLFSASVRFQLLRWLLPPVAMCGERVKQGTGAGRERGSGVLTFFETSLPCLGGDSRLQ